MTELQPLQALLAQTLRERDAALAEHQRLLAACRTAEAQTGQLRTYRTEYEQRWQAQFAHLGRMELVRCYQGFMERLTQAVEAQARTVAAVAGQAERAAQVLRDHEVRCASVRKLIERRSHDMAIAVERREQRQSDDLAAQLMRQRLGADEGQAA